MFDYTWIRNQLTLEIGLLEFEVMTLQRVFTETRFFRHPNNFPHAHFGYLMACMGRIDVLSAYWTGGVGSAGQTARMRKFLDRYLAPGKAEENRVAVQMFRHSLMHTGGLRYLYDRRHDIKYTWRVYFTSLPDGIGHYTVTTEDRANAGELATFAVSTGSKTSVIRALNVGIVPLVQDIKRAQQAYLADLATDATLQSNYRAVAPRVLIQEFVG
jgi:hypothetical protein